MQGGYVGRFYIVYKETIYGVIYTNTTLMHITPATGIKGGLSMQSSFN
jgi:hypothetical protein